MSAPTAVPALVEPGSDTASLTGTWEVDPMHSTLSFSIAYARFTVIRGTFRSFGGTIEVGAEPTSTTVDVTIEAESFDSAMPARDHHVRAADFLDVATFPQLRYQAGKAASAGGPDRYVLDGELTMHGVTRPAPLDVVWHGESHDMMGNPRLGFTATGSIDRSEWGIDWNAPVPGGQLLPNTVNLLLEVSALPEGTIARMMAAMAAQS